MIQGIQEIQPRLSEATERLRLKFDPEKIILFGSWACGDATRRSNIDLFMVWQCEVSPLDFMLNKRRRNLSKLLGFFWI